MTDRSDKHLEPKKSLEDTVDRLDAKVAEEYGTEARARETTKHVTPDEPPD